MATDRRVRYTKLALKESLLKFLREKPISRITVKEICEDADINRATYYAHYTDQYDQLKQLENDFTEGIGAYLDSFSSEEVALNPYGMLVSIFEYVDRDIELCRALLGRNGDMSFMENFVELVGERVLETWESQKVVRGSDAEYAYIFVANGSIGIIRRWLFEEKERATPQEIAGVIVRLVYNGIMNGSKGK